MSDYVSLSPAGLPESFDEVSESKRPIVSVQEHDDSIQLSYVFPGFYVGEGEAQVNRSTLSFKEVGMEGAGFLSESGKPLLPTFGRFVQIPPNCNHSVHTKVGKRTTFDGYLVTPAQENATDQSNETVELEYDAEAYSRDELYPSEITKVAEAQNLDSYKVLLIHVRPLQYNAKKNQIVAHSNIDVTIRLQRGESRGDAEEFGNLPADPIVNMEGFGNLVLNPKRRIVNRFSSLTNQTVTPMTLPQWYSPNLIIIYDAKLKSAAHQLANWKRRKGLKVSVVSIAAVGNSSAKIKEYIRSRRGFFFSRLRYVILFGDIGAIVSEEKFGKTTDHYYFTKKDTADPNECLLPWVSGGRIPVNSLSDATSVVKKIIKYEQKPPCDPEYYRRMTFAGYFQDDYPQDDKANRAYIKTLEGIRTHMELLGFDVQRVYVSNNRNPQWFKDGTVVPEEVRRAMVDSSTATDMLISEFSEGQLLAAHRDHGNRYGWHEPPFQKHHLNSILSSYPSIFYSVNCLTGQFDSDPVDSFAEDLLQMNGGAPSLIAATELSGTWRNDSLMKALFDAIWPGVIPNYPESNASYPVRRNRLGDVLNYAKAYLLVAHGSYSGVREHLEIYHVIGDPTLEIWSDEPRPLRVYAQVRNDKLMIRLYPVPADAVLTIWYRGQFRRRMAVKSPRIILSLRDLRLGNNPMGLLEVCYSAPGHRYTQTRLWLS